MAWPFDALVFDVGGVIVAHDNEAMYCRLADGCRPGTTAEVLKAAIRRTKCCLGTRPMTDLHDQLARELGYAGDWRQFVDDWSSHFEINTSMLEFVAGLARSNRVILFSNTNELHSRHVAPLMTGLGETERYLSYELGMAKPAPEAFLKVAKLAGISPQRSLFIDDVMENVRGAEQAGFQAILFTGEAALRKALPEVGLGEST